MKKETRIGTITLTAKGVGYLKNPEFEQDLEIAPGLLNTALQNDEVEVETIDIKKNPDDVEYAKYIHPLAKNPQARVIKIVKRFKTTFVGTLEEDNGHFFVIPDDKKMYTDIMISSDNIGQAKSGYKVFVEANLTDWTDHTKNPTGIIKKVIGEKGNNNAEMESIVLEKGFDVDFPEEVIEEAHNLELTERIIPDAEIKKRRDVRGTFTCTIDPYDAKDFDDALSIKKLPAVTVTNEETGEAITSDRYEIGVHIADVSHYVRPGTSLDKEGRKRAFSVYLVDRTIPMLPHILSNDVCSLNPNEDKLTFSAMFEMDLAGNVYSRWFGRTVINSNKRFTYENAQEVIVAARAQGIELIIDTNDTSKAAEIKKQNEILSGIEFAPDMIAFNTIAKSLQAIKIANGAIDFETTEIKFKLDETGKPIEVIKKDRVDTHKLVEEFMLLANREVAEFIYTDGKMPLLSDATEVITHAHDANIGDEEIHGANADIIPYHLPKDHGHHLQPVKNPSSKTPHLGVYRIHDMPDKEKIGELSMFLKALGYDLQTKKDTTPKDLQKLLKQVVGDPNETLIKTATIRSMAKAIYSTQNIGHFGLAFTYYTHFTSPIRRYPDLVVHRIMQDIINGKKMDDRDAANFTKVCMDSSAQELKAADAERQSIKYKQIEYLLPRLNETFTGKISGVTEWGIYVTEDNTLADGMIKSRDLKDDFYIFDPKKYALIGEKTKRTFTLGDKVTFKIIAGDLERKTLDCVLVG